MVQLKACPASEGPNPFTVSSTSVTAEDLLDFVPKHIEEIDQGSGSSSRCPRAGVVYLEAANRPNGGVAIRTYCKSWSCIGCRDRKRSAFMNRVDIACQAAARDFGMFTYTYKATDDRWRSEKRIASDWKQVRRLMKELQPEIAKQPWIKVTELTAKGVPHHHVLIGIPEGFKVRCWNRYGGRQFDMVQYRKGFDECLCMGHRLARLWERVTHGTSWIVLATAVDSPRGAARYLAKYLSKEFAGHGELGRRRWSSSIGFMKATKSGLAQTYGHGWRTVQFMPAKGITDEMIKQVNGFDNPLLKRREPAWVESWRERQHVRAQAKGIVKRLAPGVSAT